MTVMTVEELGERSAELGYWMTFQTSFGPAELFWVGFTPHYTTGWNGRPDHRFLGSTASEACTLAAEWLEKVEPGGDRA